MADKKYIDYTKTELNGVPIFKDKIETKAKLGEVTVIDKDWIKTRFMVTDNELEKVDAQNRYYSTANNKFTDSSLGGNVAINARPQFTRYCDIRIPGRRLGIPPVTVNGTGSYGMGRYYSESIDDNAQTVYLEFGVAKFNSLFDFFTRAIDYNDSVIANTGRKPTMYNIGKVLGAGVMLAAFPIITVAIWTIKAAYGLLAGFGAFNYYYLDPTMHNYWAMVNTIVTNISTEIGILAPEFNNAGDKANKIGTSVKINQKDLDALKKLLPGLITGSNYIDVFAIATKAQALANKQALYDKKIYDQNEDSAFDYLGYVKTKYTVSENKAAGSGIANTFNTATMFSKYIKNVVKSNEYYNKPVKPDDSNGATPSTKDVNGKPEPVSIKEEDLVRQPDGSYIATPNDDKRVSSTTSFVNAMDSSIRDGGAYAAFNVDYTGSVTESFSNSVGEIDTGNTIKSLSKKAKDVKFNLAGGNVVGEAIASIAGGVKDMLAGALDSITYGGSNVIQTLLGGGYIDIPKKWDDSSISLPQITYNMKLVSPYGNAVSQLQNIYIPLAMLMAGALPQATGKASYTSPFLCSLFSRGVQKVKLGMITSLTINRGTSNLGFNMDRRALAIDVSFTVTDFSNIMATPINNSVFDEVFNTPLYDDTPFGNYISVIGSRSLLDSKYTLPRVKLKLSRSLMAYDQAISPSSWGLRFGNSLNGVLGGFVSQSSLLNK